MNKLEVYKTVEYLEYGKLEKQVIALETAAEIVNLLALKTVETLSKAAHKFPLAERLYHFDEQYPSLAASSLAAAGVKKAINPIGDRLRSATFEEIDLIVIN